METKINKIDRKIERNDLLKLVAILAMLFDHVGYVFFPHEHAFRIIGRLALPVFAFSIANGFIHTSNLQKYITRILILAIISQPFFTLLFKSTELNILFTFSLSLLLLYFFKNKLYLFFFIGLLVFNFTPLEYCYYGFASIFFFYIFQNKKIPLLISQGIIFSLYVYLTSVYIYAFHFLGVLIILYLPIKKINIQLPKNFFYWFYPLHLLALFLLNKF